MKRYDQALGKLYPKYWKKGFASSPEMELLLGLLGSAGMFHFKNKMSKKMLGGKGGIAGMGGMGGLGAMAGMMGQQNNTMNTGTSSNFTNAAAQYDDSSDEEAP